MARRHVARIVRTEIRRRFRAVRRDDQRLGILLVAIPLGAIALLVVVGWGYALGRSTTAGDGTVVDVVESAVVTVFAYTVGITGLRGVQSTARPVALDGLLTTVRHRDVVYGHLLLEFAVAFVVAGLPVLLGGLAFALGAGSSVTAGLVVPAVASVVLTGAGLGFAIALGIRTTIARSRVVARYRFVLAVLVVVGYLLVLLVTGRSGLFEPVLEPLVESPLVWVGDLALLAVVSTADPLRAGAVVLATGGTLVGLTAVCVRLAGLLWYTTPVQPGSSADSRSRSVPSLQRLDRQTRTVVWKTWIRGIRSPLRLVYVGYAGLLVGFVLVNAIRHGDWPGWVVPVVALYGAWATGAGFTLNPIGEAGPTLPATLTSPITGRRFVGGLWLASAVWGVPITLVTSLAVASAANLPLAEVTLIGLLGAGLAALAPGVAAGIGARFPQTETEAIAANRHAVVPSFPAFLLYTIVLGSLGIPGWMAVSGGFAVTSTAGLSTVVVGIVTVGFALSIVGIAALVSYRSASARFDAYIPR